METKYRDQIIQYPEYTCIEHLSAEEALRSLDADTELTMAASPNAKPWSMVIEEPYSNGKPRREIEFMGLGTLAIATALTAGVLAAVLVVAVLMTRLF